MANGGLNSGIENSEKRQENQNYRKKNAQIANSPAQPSVGKKVMVLYFLYSHMLRSIHFSNKVFFRHQKNLLDME